MHSPLGSLRLNGRLREHKSDKFTPVKRWAEQSPTGWQTLDLLHQVLPALKCRARARESWLKLANHRRGLACQALTAQFMGLFLVVARLGGAGAVSRVGLYKTSIFMLGGQSVMLRTHLPELYGVLPKALIQAVKRNLERFPDDFLFHLISATVTASKQRTTSSTMLSRED